MSKKMEKQESNKADQLVSPSAEDGAIERSRRAALTKLALLTPPAMLTLMLSTRASAASPELPPPPPGQSPALGPF